MIFLISATALTINENDEMDVIQNLSEALYDMGLSMDFDLLTNRNSPQSRITSNLPHISRIPGNNEVFTLSEDDIDVLLAIVQIVYDNRLYGIGFDSCIDVAIVEANLEDYLTIGLRRIFQESREKMLFELVSYYTNDELYEMGLFDRFGIDFEARRTNYTQEQLMELIIGQYNTLQTSRVEFPIDHMILLSQTGRKSFPLVIGDRIDYFVFHRTIAGTSALQVGITDAGASPLHSIFYHRFPNDIFTRASTGSFIVGDIGARTPAFFALRNTSHTTSTVVDGNSYRVNW